MKRNIKNHKFIWLVIFLLPLGLLSCSGLKHKSENRINLNFYENNKIDLYNYHPDMIKKLQNQIKIDNQYIREHRSHIVRLNEIDFSNH